MYLIKYIIVNDCFCHLCGFILTLKNSGCDTNKPTSDDKYPWLESDDIRRNMIDSEILQMKLNLKDSVLDEKAKEEFLTNVEQFTDIFSLRDEIGTCPFIEVHLKLKDETPFFVRPYPMRKESHTKRNGQTRAFRYYLERTDWLQLTGCLSKMENSKSIPSCSDFCILNEKLVKIKHAFPLVGDCIEQLGRKKCHYLSTIDLTDDFLHRNTVVLCCTMDHPQFVDLVFQDDLIKHKQNFDVIMDDTFIHSTAEEHMDDLMDLFKVLRKYGLKLSSHKCQFFKKKIVYMGLEFQIQGDKVCYTPLKDKCDTIRNLESPKTLRQTRAFCGMVNFLSSFYLTFNGY